MATSDQRCTRCGRPFTPGEVTGFGFLKGRPASRGGPLVEFTCPGCGTSLRLIPHGQSRYAFPWMPPPPPASEAERAPPWLRDRKAVRGAASTAAEPEPVREVPEVDPAQPTDPEEDVPREPADAEEPPMSLEEAREILRVSADASPEDLAEAFRKRSRRCHPDKVAHLDPEFQELAMRKFDLLRRAFERLHEDP